MIFGKPMVEIQKVDKNEETIAVFEYGSGANEILITDKHIYKNSKDEFSANELIIALDAVTHTNLRLRLKKRRNIPWTGGVLILFSAILTAFTIAVYPYVKSQEIRDFLFPILYITIGAIAVIGVLFIMKRFSKSVMFHKIPKGIIYVFYAGDTHHGSDKPLRIIIPDGDFNKMREAHYKINLAIEKAKRENYGKKV